MDPTRPVDSKPVRDTGRQPIERIRRVSDAQTSKAEGRAEGDAVAASLSDVRRATQVARAQTAEIDSTRLTELRDAVSGGDYHVDPEALAERILDDAFGPETE